MTRRVYNIVTDERGQPISGVPVRIQLNTPTFVLGERKEIAAWSIETSTDVNGRWEVELEPNDLMDNPISYYKVTEYSRQRKKINEYLIRVPSSGFTDPIWIQDLLITPPVIVPSITIGLSVGDGNNVITTGFKGAIYVPFSGMITEWTILSTDRNPPTSGSIEIDILKGTYADYPTMSSMVGTGTKPNIANSNKGQGTPTGWATNLVNAGDCIGFQIVSVSSLKRVTIVLKVVKS